MKTLRHILLPLLFLMVFTGAVQAQSWTPVYDSNTANDFSTTQAAGAAGSTLVNGWTDANGGIWSLANGLVGTTSNSSGYTVDYLFRPTSENQINERVITTFVYTSQANLGTILRYQTSNSAYLVALLLGSISVYKIQAGGVTSVGNGTYAQTNGDTYTCDCNAIGSAPTTINVTVTDTTHGTNAGTYSVTDSTANLQGTGRYGLVVWPGNSNSSDKYSRVQTFSNTGGALVGGAISSTSTTNSSITPQEGTISGGAYPYSTVFSYSTSTNGTYTQIGTAVSGTTPVANAAATGLSASTTYYFRAVTTDSTSGTPLVVTSPSSTTGTPIMTLAPGTMTASGSLVLGGSSETITLTGTGTLWQTTAPSISLSGITGSRLVSTTVNSNTSITLLVNPGVTAGTMTITDASTGASSTLAVAARPVTGNVIFLGDSLTYSTYCSSGGGTVTGTSYPADVMALLGGNWVGANLGQSGETLATMISNATGTGVQSTSANYQSGKTYNVVVILGGHNDYNAGYTSAQVYAEQVSLCGLWRAAHYKVVICTEPPAAYPSYPVNFDALRDGSNALIRANWRTFADGLADLGGDATIGLDGDEYNSTYFASDYTHGQDPGYAIYAKYVGSAVAALGNSSVAPSGSGTLIGRGRKLQ